MHAEWGGHGGRKELFYVNQSETREDLPIVVWGIDSLGPPELLLVLLAVRMCRGEAGTSVKIGACTRFLPVFSQPECLQTTTVATFEVPVCACTVQD